MNPRTLLRVAALQALSTAANNAGTDPDFAPLPGVQAFLGQTFPTQSPGPGLPPSPPQLLIYCWDDDAETVSDGATAPQFRTTMSLAIECRFETKALAAPDTLSGTAGAGGAFGLMAFGLGTFGAGVPVPPIQAAVDGVLDALMFAVKKAICGGIGVAAVGLNNNKAFIDSIKAVKTTAKYALEGQRIAANGALLFDLAYGELFEPMLGGTPLETLAVLVGGTAGAVANSGNTGNGTISAVTVGLGVLPGSYAIAFVSVTAFTVTAPDSSAAGTGTVGKAFTGGGLTFTITAGPTAYVEGDGYTVVVQVAAETQTDLSS